MSTANLLIGVGTNVSSEFIEYKFQAQHMKHFCGHCFEFASVFVSIKKLYKIFYSIDYALKRMREPQILSES